MKIDRALIRDLFTYGFVAVFALAADFGSLLALHAAGVQYLVAATIAFLIGTVVNFVLSHGRVFKDPVIKNRAANFTAFTAIGLLGLVGNDVILWIFHAKVGLGLAVAKAIAVVVVFGWNFLARRQFLYKGHRDVPISKEISFES